MMFTTPEWYYFSGGGLSKQAQVCVFTTVPIELPSSSSAAPGNSGSGKCQTVSGVGGSVVNGCDLLTCLAVWTTMLNMVHNTLFVIMVLCFPGLIALCDGGVCAHCTPIQNICFPGFKIIISKKGNVDAPHKNKCCRKTDDKKKRRSLFPLCH